MLPPAAAHLPTPSSSAQPQLHALPSQIRRTPHSPSSPSGMASPRSTAAGGAAAAVRPVTARTWQASLAAPAPLTSAAAADTASMSPRRMQVYTNDLYGAGGSAAAATTAASERPASPLYQPASARPGTPTPKSAERLQQQRIATPSRLQVERSPTPGQRLQQVAGAGATLSTANVPAAPAAGERQAQVQQAVQLDEEIRPSTAPSAAPGSSLRTSTFSLSALKPHLAAHGLRPSSAGTGTAASAAASSSIALDSPRVRQQVLRNFAGAVPAGASGSNSGGTSPLGTSPRPTLHGERGRGSVTGARPSTPSFRPVAQTARPATALAGPSFSAAAHTAASPSASASDHFTIKASHTRADSGPLMAGPTGAYPRPPLTAPTKVALQEVAAAVGGPPARPAPGSLASFGIASAAFVAAAPKGAAGRAVVGGGEGENQEGGPRALTQAALLASAASLATKADLRYQGRWGVANGPRQWHCLPKC